MISTLLQRSGSFLEDSSSLGALFDPTQFPHIYNAGLQLGSLSPQDDGNIFDSQDALPSIDESLFDCVDVPELEEVAGGDLAGSVVLSFEDELFEEIPSLEDPDGCGQEVGTETIEWAEPKVPTETPWPVPAVQQTNPTITIDSLFVDDRCTPTSFASPSSYGEASGLGSPLSCYSPASTVDEAGSEKRRRISQISISSYCSSAGDSMCSPATSDSDFEVKKSPAGGRRSRYTVADRKERKKAQNRTAAERYRQKRKQQEETISEEEQLLIDGNGELRIEVTKLQAEVSCMKKLLREMLRAKGVEIPPKKKMKLSA